MPIKLDFTFGKSEEIWMRRNEDLQAAVYGTFNTYTRLTEAIHVYQTLRTDTSCRIQNESRRLVYVKKRVQRRPSFSKFVANFPEPYPGDPEESPDGPTRCRGGLVPTLSVSPYDAMKS